MKTVDVLKGAKPFLMTERLERHLVPCICYAITDYVGSVYGEGNIFIPGHEANKLRDDAQSLISHKLRELTSATFFGELAAAKVLGKHYSDVTYSDIQKARHQWLDSLIKELENENS